jgi:hypothetical protein
LICGVLVLAEKRSGEVNQVIADVEKRSEEVIAACKNIRLRLAKDGCAGKKRTMLTENVATGHVKKRGGSAGQV